MRYFRLVTVVAPVVFLASPAFAQQQTRGLLEFGTYGRYDTFDDGLNLKNRPGIGGLVAVFLNHRFQLAGEGSYAPSEAKTSGQDFNYVPLYARVVYNAPIRDRAALLIGGGLVRADYGFGHNYGPSALLGMRLALVPGVSLRADFLTDYLPDPNYTNLGFRVGLSAFRRPSRSTRIIESPGVVVAAASVVVPDSGMMAEVDRLRLIELQLNTLRDSLGRVTTTAAATVEVLAALETIVYFDFDVDALDDNAVRVLDAKLPIFAANPELRILITGNADSRGSDEYNLALGLRRAVAAKRYLVDRGIDAGRIEVVSFGEENPADPRENEEAWARNRRDEFRVMTSSELAMPRE
jgi:peptidoglycan-associated lipoprotein